MTDERDSSFDPVFNDIESETTLPIGTGEFMRVGSVTDVPLSLIHI